MSKARSAGQVLSAGVVVLTLIFVGLEVRQNTKAQRAQTRQALADGSREFVLTVGADPELVRIYYGVFRPGWPGDALLTQADTFHAGVLMTANIRNVENVFLQSDEGVIDESVMSSYGFVSPSYESPAFAKWWRDHRGRLDAAFVAAFEAANKIQ